MGLNVIPSACLVLPEWNKTAQRNNKDFLLPYACILLRVACINCIFRLLRNFFFKNYIYFFIGNVPGNEVV
jgi:hypothetical protein